MENKSPQTFKRVNRNGVSLKGDMMLVFKSSRVTAVRVWGPWASTKTLSKPYWRNIIPPIDLSLLSVRRNLHKIRSYAEQAVPGYKEGGEEEERKLKETNMRMFLKIKIIESEIQTYQKLFLNIPDNVRILARRYRPKWHYHMLKLAYLGGNEQGEGPATDLMYSNPALAFIMANSRAFSRTVTAKKKPFCYSCRHIWKRQKNILPLFGFPGTNQAAKILRKIKARDLTVESMFYLRQCMNRGHEYLRILSCLPFINETTIVMLTHPVVRENAAGIMSPTLLEEISRTRGVIRRRQILYEIIQGIEQMQLNGRRIPRIRNYEHFQQLETAMYRARRNFNYRPRLSENLEFPPPPIPGNTNWMEKDKSLEIAPIETPAELSRETKLMHHCIESFAFRIAGEKNLYAYRILEPERATLMLIREGSKWNIYDIRRECNKKCSSKTERMVETWLECQDEFHESIPVDELMDEEIVEEIDAPKTAYEAAQLQLDFD